MRALMVTATLTCCFTVAGCDTPEEISAERREIVISDVAVCDSCIRAGRAGELRSLDSVAFGRMDLSRIARTNDGVLWISPTAMGHAVVRVDGDEERWITARGRGPREFRSVSSIVAGPGDTLHVIGDGKINRYTSSGDFVRTSPLPIADRPRRWRLPRTARTR